MTYELSADTRTQTGKMAARRLRREGKIPGVCYGSAVAPFGVALDPVQLDRLLRTSPQGRNSIIELDAGEAGRHHVMVQEIQRDPVKRSAVHVDFRVVHDDDPVIVSVPVQRTGRSPAEDMGGRMELVRRRVDVACAVKNIPDSIVQDVSGLKLGERIRASELQAPEGCRIHYKSDFVVLNIVAPRGIAAGEEEGEEGLAEVAVEA